MTKVDLRKFKDVVGYEGLYKINKDSDIYSIKSEKIIIPQKNEYVTIKLYKNGKGTRRSVHRLVAEAYKKNPNNKPLVNHKDGNKHNNNASNLEWSTHKENAKHAYDLGLIIRNDQIKKGAKIVKQLETNGRMVRMFASIHEASRMTGFDRSDISKCCRKIRKTCSGYIWRYKNAVEV
jgi:hypothetical protein